MNWIFSILFILPVCLFIPHCCTYLARPRVTFMSQVFQGRETLGLVMVKIEWIGRVAVQTKLKLTPFELTDVPHPARGREGMFTVDTLMFQTRPLLY